MSEIQYLTQSLISLITNANLDSVLQKHRIVRVLHLFYREQNLLDTLSAVERQKLSLCLTIEQIQSTTLYEIKADLRIMAGDKKSSEKKRVPSFLIPKKAAKAAEGKRSSRRAAVDDKPKTAAGAASMPDETANNQIMRLPKAERASASDERTRVLINAPPAIEAGPSSYGNDANSSTPRGRRVTSSGNINDVTVEGKAHVGLLFDGHARRLASVKNDMKFVDLTMSGEDGQTSGLLGDIYGDLESSAGKPELSLGKLVGHYEHVRIEGKGENEAGAKPVLGAVITWRETVPEKHRSDWARVWNKSEKNESEKGKREKGKSEKNKSERSKSRKDKSGKKKGGKEN
ncbi:hypothetical protein NQ176_g5515 [Zarea fungicola]|uniref:Uncharacterized protein n=1 Tax=Zarea fungicola TaxID=93591 RepID=A0ACC1N9H6_9HYPO|nr:hypothetical protein NQ176_g5515 [Lecanicillium fungicola]